MTFDHSQIISIVISSLLAANIFFVKALVNKIGQIDNIKELMATHHAQFSTQISNLQEQLMSLSTQVNAVSDLRARVSVLEFASNKFFTLAGNLPKIPGQGE